MTEANTQVVETQVARTIEAQDAPVVDTAVVDLTQPLPGEPAGVVEEGHHIPEALAELPVEEAPSDIITDEQQGLPAEDTADAGEAGLSTGEAVSHEELAAAIVEESKPVGVQQPYKEPTGPLSLVHGIYGVEALKELGFSEAFLNNNTRRTVIFGTDEGLPLFNEGFKGGHRAIELWAAITGITVISNEEKSLTVSVLHTEARLHFLFKKEKRVWSFYIDRTTAADGKEAVARLLQNNLQLGEEKFKDTAGLLDGFWGELLKAVYTEPTVIELKLDTHPKQDHKNISIPVRVKLNPADVSDVTISIGGWCYDFNLSQYPAVAIGKGVKQFLNEKSKQDKSKNDGIIRGNVPKLKKRQEKVVRNSAIQQMKSEAPVLGYGRTPPAKPQPQKKELIAGE